MFEKTDISVKSKLDYEEQISMLENKYGAGTCKQSDIELMAKDMLFTLPYLNRDRLREEMASMHVDIYVEPTTFNINEGLAKSQMYRERLASILVLAERECNVRAKVLEMLVMASGVMSKASSADKRKGEAIMHYATQFIYLEAANTFRDEVKTYLDNMKATSETISRQASVIQAQITLGEIRRKDVSFSQAENNLSFTSPTSLGGTQEISWQ